MDDTRCTINTNDTVAEMLDKFSAESEKAATASRIRVFFYGRELNSRDVAAACGLRKDDLVVLAVLYE